MAQGRWKCSHCGTEGWRRDGAVPPHDTPRAKSCRFSGQISEAAARCRLAERIYLAEIEEKAKEIKG
jgi:hypothetical protein